MTSSKNGASITTNADHTHRSVTRRQRSLPLSVRSAARKGRLRSRCVVLPRSQPLLTSRKTGRLLDYGFSKCMALRSGVGQSVYMFLRPNQPDLESSLQLMLIW